MRYARRMRMAGLVVVLLASVGCQKRWRETETFGAVTVLQDWKSYRLAWESSGTGVERWTIEAHGAQLVRDWAQVYVLGNLVVVETMPTQTEHETVLLDQRTGEPATCEHCTCAFSTSPLGPALPGGLTSWTHGSVASYAMYDARHGSELCVVHLDDTTYRTRRVAWPKDHDVTTLLAPSTGDPLAIACEQNTADVATAQPQTCLLVQLTEFEARVVDRTQTRQPWRLTIQTSPTPKIIDGSL